MTDPVGGQLANRAVEVAQTAQSAAEGAGKGEGTQSFNLEGPGGEGEMGIDTIEGVEAPEAIEGAGEIPMDDFLQGMLRDEAEIRELMELCLSGGAMGQQEMLQMQALIYSYSQRVDLTTKVVEKATSGVQQMMNTQV